MKSGGAGIIRTIPQVQNMGGRTQVRRVVLGESSHACRIIQQRLKAHTPEGHSDGSGLTITAARNS